MTEAAGPGPSEVRIRGAMWTAIQVAGCLVAFWVIVKFRLIEFELLAGMMRRPAIIVEAMSLVLVTVPVSALRWFLILRALGIEVRFPALLRVTAVSLAGNALILGGIGGELARVTFAARCAKGSRLAAMSSLIVDRALALMGVLAVGSAMSVASLDAIRHSPILSAGALFLFGALTTATVVMVFAIFGAGHSKLITISKNWVHPRWLVSYVLNALNTMAAYRRNWRVLLIAAALSAFNAFLGVVALLVLRESQPTALLGLGSLGFASSLAAIANLLPISPGGLGVGEGVFAQFCVLLSDGGSGAQYGTLFLGARVASTAALLAGMLVLVGHAHLSERR